ncbi:MAG: hypothetical protein HY906_25180 [Deltaproteobacteria bacterium]|nr:hypothetical protein [Deltaproteobacteria bacterium]
MRRDPTGRAIREGAPALVRDFLERATNPRIEKPFDADELRALVRTVVG